MVPSPLFRRSHPKLRFDVLRTTYYTASVILSFKNKATAALFSGLAVKGLPPAIAQRGFDKLRMLDSAAELDDLRVPPSNRLEKLVGNRKGQWSIRINDQWRICFRFEAGNAYEVEVADYH